MGPPKKKESRISAAIVLPCSAILQLRARPSCIFLLSRLAFFLAAARPACIFFADQLMFWLLLGLLAFFCSTSAHFLFDFYSDFLRFFDRSAHIFCLTSARRSCASLLSPLAFFCSAFAQPSCIFLFDHLAFFVWLLLGRLAFFSSTSALFLFSFCSDIFFCPFILRPLLNFCLAILRFFCLDPLVFFCPTISHLAFFVWLLLKEPDLGLR
jgi:hypothetical protein